MEKTYRITVIMGIYNCASTLQEALDSLYAQTYQNFKIILCDDGSTDDTYTIASEYIKSKNNIKLIKNKTNIKLAATLNKCLEYADTEYVARMDGDDISLPTRFEEEIKFLDENPEYAFVSTAMIYFDEKGNYGRNYPIEKPTKESFRKSTPFCHAPCMVRLSAYKAVNGYTTDKKVERMEDYYLWHKMYLKGLKGYNIQAPLYKMRNDRNAHSRRKISDRIRGYKVDIEICKNLGLTFPYFYPILHLGKIFIPWRLIAFFRKKLFMSQHTLTM